jgi:peroxiredoxin
MPLPPNFFSPRLEPIYLKPPFFSLSFILALALGNFAHAADAPTIATPVAATPTAAPLGDPDKELTALHDSIVARLHQGASTEQDFAVELQKFDQLVAEHQGDKSDPVAKFLLSKAALYLQIFNDREKATAVLRQLLAQFPNTPSATAGAQALAQLNRGAPATPAAANPGPATTGDADQELTALHNSIIARLHTGASTEQDFAVELKKFDQLLAEHQGDKSDLVAKILLSKAALYLQVFKDEDKSAVVLRQLVAQFPNTPSAASGAQVLSGLDRKAAAAALYTGAQFPDFSGVDMDGRPLSISSYKGQIVLIDFWATWCDPWVKDLPNLLAVYQKYHARSFDIIGISLDKENQHDMLAAFVKANKMPWREYYDGKYWESTLAIKYGVVAIPQSYLLDGQGRILAVSPHGTALTDAIEAALAAKK